MAVPLAEIVAQIDRTICGHSIVVPIHAGSPLWLVLANAALLVVVTLATLGTIVAAGYFLVRPGEKNPDHPKYSILNADR